MTASLLPLLWALAAAVPAAPTGLVRAETPRHRPVYVKVETAPPCDDVALGRTLLKLRPLLAQCAARGGKTGDGTFRMGTAIFQVQLGGKRAKVDAGKGSLSAAVRGCMARKVLARLPVGPEGWPREKCSVRLTIRAD